MRRVGLIRKKKFLVIVLDLEVVIFVVHVVFIRQKSNVHLSRKAQIALLNADKAPNSIFPKYTDYANILSKTLIAKLPKYTRINNHAIDLIKRRPSLYRYIYQLRPVELETLKTSIEINLVNGFIRISKSLYVASILFMKKPDRNRQLYINYGERQSLNY